MEGPAAVAGGASSRVRGPDACTNVLLSFIFSLPRHSGPVPLRRRWNPSLFLFKLYIFTGEKDADCHTAFCPGKNADIGHSRAWNVARSPRVRMFANINRAFCLKTKPGLNSCQKLYIFLMETVAERGGEGGKNRQTADHA